MAGDTPPVDTLDPAELEAFLDDLTDHGFVPDDEDRRVWWGPLPDVLAEFTEATTMRIVLRDGLAVHAAPDRRGRHR